MTEGKPLQPLTEGRVLIVGIKPSNLDEEILTHPRVLIWDSQQEHWTNKELPSNVRAVFCTRWIGHNAFANILTQARKRHITIFNPEGTGIIARQVRELLIINKPVREETTVPTTNAVKSHGGFVAKLHPLIPFIDFNKTTIENARTMMAKANELGISTTLGSLGQLVSQQRKKSGLGSSPRYHGPKTRKVKPKPESKLDVSVELLDNAIRDLKDMREFLIATVNENAKLKARLDKFRRVFED